MGRGSKFGVAAPRLHIRWAGRTFGLRASLLFAGSLRITLEVFVAAEGSLHDCAGKGLGGRSDDPKFRTR